MTLISKNFSLLLLSIIILLVSNNYLADKQNKLMITTPPPSKKYLDLFTVGEKQLLFRNLMLELQYMGDSYGRSSNINKYDYELIYQWLKSLDYLDIKSNFAPSQAAYYFGNNVVPEQVNWMIKYLKEHSLPNLSAKWWWAYQASYLAFHRAKDSKTAIDIANIIYESKDVNIPIWVRQLSPIYYSKNGEDEHALKIIKTILIDYAADIDEDEKNYMNYFINERLDKINKGK